MPDIFVRNTLSLQLRLMRLADTFRDFTITEERAHAAFSRYRELEWILQERLNANVRARMTVKPWVTAHLNDPTMSCCGRDAADCDCEFPVE